MTTATIAPQTAAAPEVAEPHPIPVLDWKGDAPIRVELCSPTQFRQPRPSSGHSDAAVGRRAPRPALAARGCTANNGRVLRARLPRRVAVAAARQEPLTPDAEWLLDNFHIIEDVLREVRTDLPRGATTPAN